MGETHHRIDDALRKGANLLCVRLHKRPLISQDEDGGIHVPCSGAQAKRKLARSGCSRAFHAREIHYWGSWAVEDVPST